MILRLLHEGAPLTHNSVWFELHEATLQLKPWQAELPVAVASSISPAGMSCAGKYGVGVLSVASYSEEGPQALPTQWSFAETYARENGNTMDRRGGAIFGTPDDAVAAIARLLAFAHDWASHEATKRSYHLFARCVIPRVNGLIALQQPSAVFVSANRTELMEGGSQAILAAIRKHDATHPRAR